jgi:hypothetical protein
MASIAVDEGLPIATGFAFGQRLVEGGLRIFRRADIGLLGDCIALAGELYRLHRRTVRLLRQLRVNPSVILLADREGLGRWRLAAWLAARHGLLHSLAAELRNEVGALLAVLWLERVEPNDRTDAIVNVFERAGGWPSAEGMRDQADIPLLLLLAPVFLTPAINSSSLLFFNGTTASLVPPAASADLVRRGH